MEKCKLCGEKFNDLEGLHKHLGSHHADSIPKDFSISQFQYSLRTGKSQGKCIICGKKTEWNEKTYKYYRFCNNPTCKQTYRDKFKQNMIGAHGKIHLLNDPTQQRKMLANRAISGRYTWSDGTQIPYTGSYELDFLKFLDVFMDFNSNDIMSPSPHTYYYEYEGEKKFYIPDIFIPSLNLEIEIKDGGSNPNTHHKIMAVDKKKEELKDKVMTGQTVFSYIKLVDKKYDVFFEYLYRLKKQYSENQDGEVNEKPIFIIRPSLNTPNIGESVRSVVTESTNDEKALNPVFILLTYTDTVMAKTIRFFTGDPYSHASITFDSTLKDVYSFGRKFKDDKMTFINEQIDKGVFRDVSERANYSLYAFLITDEQKEYMLNRLNDFKRLGDKLKFSLIGLVNVAMGKETSRENEWFCSQFVAEILKAGKFDQIKRDVSLYKPYDLAKIRGIKFVAKGKLKNYSQSRVDTRIRQLIKDMSSTELVVKESLFRKKSDPVDTESMLARFRSVVGLPSRYKSNETPMIYFGLTEKEANSKEIVYPITKDFSLKGINLTIDGLKRFIHDNNLSKEVKFYAEIPLSTFFIETSVEFDPEYDMVAAVLPITIRIDKANKIK